MNHAVVDGEDFPRIFIFRVFQPRIPAGQIAAVKKLNRFLGQIGSLAYESELAVETRAAISRQEKVKRCNMA